MSKALEAAARGAKGAMVNRGINPEHAGEIAYSAVLAFLRAALEDEELCNRIGRATDDAWIYIVGNEHAQTKAAIQALIDEVETKMTQTSEQALTPLNSDTAA